jgi:alkaline phosphatase D
MPLAVRPTSGSNESGSSALGAKLRPRLALSRRQALRQGLRLTAGLALQPLLAAPALAGGRLQPDAPQALRSDPFRLGVAAGEPRPDGFVLWTRLAPDPLEPESGLVGDVPIRCEIAEDPTMQRILRDEIAVAEAGFAHSVHLELTGLAPDRPYWYRFMTDGAVSPVGCARTAPAAGAPLKRLRFAFVSCANYEQGYFAAYRHLAEEAPDLVLFLGDYIYESIDRSAYAVRHHSDGVPATTLAGYRNRYAQYRLDPDLRAVHAAAPCLMTWDDHEVQNDYAGEWSQDFEAPEAFLARRAAAYRAYYEHMPLSPTRSHPDGAAMRVYDAFGFGDLANIAMLDGRQYRSREACYGPPNGGGHVVTAAGCPELIDPTRSMLGRAQEDWLYGQMANSTARWNLIGQNVVMAAFLDGRAAPESHRWTDAWDGYPANRRRLIDHIASSRVANPVVLTGDNHAFWVNDLKRDFNDRHAPAIATEFVGTSITSFGPPYDLFMSKMPDNPHVHYFESRKRGYVSVDLSPRQMTTRFRALSDAADPEATIGTLATFVVEAGRKGAVSA